MNDMTASRDEGYGLMERILYEVKKVVVVRTISWNGSWWRSSPTGTCWSRACPAWRRR